MSDKQIDIIIIGAGIAGLSAGCYAQMNGYRTQIFEMHNLPGGLCTAWNRKGYVFDGCIHYLFGSGKNQPFYQMWEELGAVQGRQFIDHDEFMRIVAPDGKTLIVYTDPDRLERHMLSLSPRDSKLIKEFCAGIWDFTDFDMSLLLQKPKALMGLGDWLHLGTKMLPFLGLLNKWGNISASEFAKRFHDPFLRYAVAQMFAWESIPMMVGMSLLAYMYNKNAGFPVGASLEFAKAIEKRYLELGGKIYYSSQVERIIVKNNQAYGVRLYNNQEYYAHRVISACDGRGTIFDMLGGQFLNHKIKKLYDGHLPLHSQLQVSLGLNRDLSKEPHWVTYILNKPIIIAGEKRYEIGVKHYCFDHSLAPAGKSVMIIMLSTPYDYWQRIYGRPLYDAEQIQESQILIDQLEQFYPGIKADIEFMDVATPLSYERYTGNWQGASCGWLLGKETMSMMIAGMEKTLPGLDNFYMIGQWVEPGGSVPIVAMSGRNIIQQICYEDEKKFIVLELL
ncbi:carotene isomerase [Calothrix sp. NIES-4071]|nr:carotene isomerase [Calothrix sp. NIES-4071]BAZ56186.1 carotene isomerase [Calothrix sp. NIES-4105]